MRDDTSVRLELAKQMNDALLPCPFCGVQPHATLTVNGTEMFYVRCQGGCGIEMKAAWYRGEDAPTKDLVATWNRRTGRPELSAPPSDPGVTPLALEKRLREAADVLRYGSPVKLGRLYGTIALLTDAANALVDYQAEVKRLRQALAQPVGVTPLDLEPIEARLRDVADGPWHFENGADRERYGHRIYDAHCWGVCKPTRGSDAHDRANAEFICHARQDVPALLAEVKRLRQALAVRQPTQECPACKGKGVVGDGLMLSADGILKVAVCLVCGGTVRVSPPQEPKS